MNDLVLYQPPPPPTPNEWDSIRNAGIQFSKSDMVPTQYRGKPENVCVALVTARDLGIPWTLALQRGFVIEGKFDLPVEIKLGIVQRNVPDFDYEVMEQSDERVIVTGGRTGKKQHTVEFTFDMAEQSGYTRGRNGIKDNWLPGRRADTLLWRALSRLIKRCAPGAMFLTPLPDSDEHVDPEGDSPRPVVAREPSSASVLENVPTAADVAPVIVETIPVDWMGRLLNAVADHYAIAAKPPDHENGRAKWRKSNGKLLGTICNLYYQALGEKPVTAWIAVPPMDYERIALWLEERNSKRAAGEPGTGAPVEQEAPPAASEPAPEAALQTATEAVVDDLFPPDAPPPPEEAAAAPSSHPKGPVETLAGESVDGFLVALEELRFASKGARRYYERTPSGRAYLCDGVFLDKLGYGVKSQFVDDLLRNDVNRSILARLIVEERGKR